ncbi:DUF87 domain-containing protein [Candidatus Woesearchaeota archaeon]|nr:DUF87 domain-containing protein [Candidatus Woesearchaeota archaeon]
MKSLNCYKKEVNLVLFLILILSLASAVLANEALVRRILDEEFSKSQEILRKETSELLKPLEDSLDEINDTYSHVKFYPGKIKKVIFPGEYFAENLQLTNTLDTSIEVSFNVSKNVSKFISFDLNNIETKIGMFTIKPQETVILPISIKANYSVIPNLYIGFIDFFFQEKKYKMPVIIDVLHSRANQIELILDPINEGSITEDLKIQLQVNNPLPVSVDSRLIISLLDTQTRENLLSQEYSLHVEEFFSDVVVFEIPESFDMGTYILSGELVYPYQGSTISTFSVVPLKLNIFVLNRRLFGLKLWYYVYILLSFGLVAGGIFVYRWSKERKKRYHLPLYLKSLPLEKKDSRVHLGLLSETDKNIYFDVDNLMTHTIIAGSTGGGKTVAAQGVVEHALDKKIGVVVFDPTAQWTGFFRKNDDNGMYNYYPKFGLHKKDAKSYPGTIIVIKDALQKIDLKKHMNPGEITVFSLHKLEPREIDIFVASTVKQVFSQGLDENPHLKSLMVYDEVHRLLPKFGGSGAGFVQIERACREFRKWGIGLVLISQVLSDFVGEIKANINTEVQMRTKDEGDLERLRTKYGEEVLRSVVKAETGNGMMNNPSYNKGKPFMVNFRPLLHSPRRLKEADLEKYIGYSDRLEEIIYNVELLEEKGVDVFDFNLEIKLAKEKLCSGSFTMVDMYFEGLNTRLDDVLSSNGMSRSKVPIEKIDMDELRDDIERAREVHENGG